jgi:hypothetical protein
MAENVMRMMRGRMERTVRSGEPQAYTAALADVWGRVGTALARLERIAESPAQLLGEELLDELPGLQYSLHAGAELAVGIEPPAEAEPLHAELVAALAEARDATAEMAAALGTGEDDLVAPLLPEWRGTLFRVRLARLRTVERRDVAAMPAQARRRKPDPEGTPPSAIVATALVLGGAFLFTAGAVLVAWPVWAAGLALFAGGFVLYRP